jgi:secreted trypsin-like serine protease
VSLSDPRKGSVGSGLVRSALSAFGALLLSIGLPATATPAHAIVGGKPAQAVDYPWLAAVGSPLLFVRPSGQFCGGVLITPDTVLTAAHCAQPFAGFPRALTVTFGRSNLWDPDGVTVGVAAVHVDPDFAETSFDGTTVEHHDLARLTLAQPQHRPLARLEGAANPKTATALGWGGTSESDLLNTALRAATVPLVSDRACAAAYGPAFDPHDMRCAGSTSADTATFDSGGPLLSGDGVIGLTSWGLGSARPGYPGVYTRVG